MLIGWNTLGIVIYAHALFGPYCSPHIGNYAGPQKVKNIIAQCSTQNISKFVVNYTIPSGSEPVPNHSSWRGLFSASTNFQNDDLSQL